MFYYFGRKKQIAKYYPKPTEETIIEPFAGSAAYALHNNHWEKDVVLIERDEKVTKLWNWLIDEATEKEIKNLPDLDIGEKTSDFLHIVHAATKQAFYYKTIKVTKVLERNWRINKKYMAENVYKVKHWTIINGDYKQAPNIRATWFIDPPYQFKSGSGYRYGNDQLDYQKLAQWTKQREGQVIFCERENANYLNFEDLTNLPSVAGKYSKERIYYQIDGKQQLLSN